MLIFSCTIVLKFQKCLKLNLSIASFENKLHFSKKFKNQEIFNFYFPLQLQVHYKTPFLDSCYLRYFGGNLELPWEVGDTLGGAKRYLGEYLEIQWGELGFFHSVLYCVLLIFLTWV